MYSSNAASPAFGASKPVLSPAVRYSGVGAGAQPLSQPEGYVRSRRHAFVPVSNAFTGATSIAGSSSFRK